jgi:hypothetical protein
MDQEDQDQELQDQLVLLQAKLVDKVREYLLPWGYEILHDLIFIVAYQNDKRHTARITHDALVKILEKYKDQ